MGEVEAVGEIALRLGRALQRDAPELATARDGEGEEKEPPIRGNRAGVVIVTAAQHGLGGTARVRGTAIEIEERVLAAVYELSAIGRPLGAKIAAPTRGDPRTAWPP